mgnify:CR=1 FL=1
MIKYFVRTTNDREFNYDLEYIELVDKDYKPIDSFINQLKLISEYDSVLLEDDLILCKDFKNKIESVIKQYPNDIINFFYNPFSYFTTHYIYSGFAWTQCTYYPKGKSLQIANEMERLRDKYPRLQYDLLEGRALESLNLRHLIYRPCLVQHIDNKSLIQKNIKLGYRRTIYFQDYLDELEIDYNEAHKKENRQRMQGLLQKQFSDRGE